MIWIKKVNDKKRTETRYLAATLMQNVKHQLCLVGGFSVCEALPVAYFARISYFYVSRALSMDLLLVQLPDCYSCVEKKTSVEDIFVRRVDSTCPAWH
jgi:hypothetical protein